MRILRSFAFILFLVMVPAAVFAEDASPAYLLAGDLVPIPVTEQPFFPPTWLQPDCQGEIAVASASIILPKPCLNQKSDRHPYAVIADERVMERIYEVHHRLNALMMGNDPQDQLAIANEKRRLLLEFGIPTSALQLAYGQETLRNQAGEEWEFDSVVLVVRVIQGDRQGEVVLVADVEDAIFWQYSRVRFYGIQHPLMPEQWLAVSDDRDDPGADHYEWLCLVEECEVVPVE